MKSNIHRNIFDQSEIDRLIKYFNLDVVPFESPQLVNSEIQCRDKGLGWDKPVSVVRSIVGPKLRNILGRDFKFITGTFKESIIPYVPHVDNNYLFKRADLIDEYDRSAEGVAFLIPLMEDQRLMTVTFDVYDEKYDMGEDLHESWTTGHNDISIDEFGHLAENVRKDINKINVDQIFHWKMGDMLSWTRDQLHTSNDFRRHGIIKKFLILHVI